MTYAYQGERVETGNKCLSGKESSIGKLSSLLVKRDKKSVTTFSLLVLSIMVISNYCNNNRHLVTLALVTGLFIRYLMAEWSVCTNVGYPVI